MGLIQGKGTEIKFGGTVDLKKVFIRLKENQSIKVRVLGLEDYIKYKAHGEFALKVYTQPCIAPLGTECPFCVASKSGIDGFDKLKAKDRYLFAFGDIETGELRVWDCSYTQAMDIVEQIKEYADNISDTAFNFKRTGSGTNTLYKLNPILKMKDAEVTSFHVFDEAEVPMKFFEDCLVPRTTQLMMDVLDDAGFPVNQYFPDFVKTGTDVEGEGVGEPVDDGDIPF